MQSVHPTKQPKPAPWAVQELSEAQFLGALTNLLPSILPAVGSLVGGLFGSGSSQGTTSNAGANNPLAALSNPDTIQQIVQLIGRLTSNGNAAAERSAGQATAPANAAVASPQAQALALALVDNRREPISDAMVAPALLAALPALMPILQQVLTPQTVQSIVQAPQRGVQQIINGITDVAKLGLQSHEQDLRHLRALNPGVEDPALNQLLLSMSAGLRQMKGDPRYKRVASVRLSMPDVASHTLSGRTSVLYREGQDLRFPVVVETPRSIRRAVFEIAVKRADTLEVIMRKRQTAINVASGPHDGVPQVPGSTFAGGSATHPDYIVCITLLWKNRAGEKRGTSLQQTIRLVGDYAFDSIRDSANLLPLTNASKYRDYWHKVWETDLSKQARKVAVELEYTYGLSLSSPSNERLETTNQTHVKRRTRLGSLSSGMDLSLQALNRLLPTIDSTLEPLPPNTLASLSVDDFADRVNQRARYKIRLRGLPGQTAGIWVYPEVKIQDVILQQPTAVNENGNVTKLAPASVRFPLPALIHVVGVLSK